MPPQTNSNLEQRYATNCHGTVGLRHSYLSYHPMLAFPRDDNIIIETVRLLMSMKIDRIQDNRIRWGDSYWDQNSEPYQVLEGEVDYAVSS